MCGNYFLVANQIHSLIRTIGIIAVLTEESRQLTESQTNVNLNLNKTATHGYFKINIL